MMIGCKRIENRIGEGDSALPFAELADVGPNEEGESLCSATEAKLSEENKAKKQT